MPTSPAPSSSSSSTATTRHHPSSLAELEQRLAATGLQQRRRGSTKEEVLRQRRPSSELVPDPGALLELEAHARGIASNIDMALRDLRGSLRGMSDLTCESSHVFGSVVHSTCDSVDAAIRSTYAMLAKAEEFNAAVRGLEPLLAQIGQVSRLLDQFEAQLQEAVDEPANGSSPVSPLPPAPPPP